MSASLVGSEMCIRDRHLTAPPQHPHNSTTAPRSTLTQVLRRCCEDAVRAVSYTHLTLPTICSV
eukprot:591473-Alexandrium_andersonii.AAC.1